MYYNPYETKDAKKRRITSNIALVLLGVMLVAGILALIFRDKSNPKYDFEHFKAEPVSLAQISEGKNEFKALMEYGEASNSPVFNDSFKEQFPISTALLNMDSEVYTSDKPYVSIKGGYMALAQCVVSNAVDCRDLTVTLIRLQQSQSDSSLTLNMSQITEFSVRYNTRDKSLPLMYLPKDQGTHINLYKFSMKLCEPTLTESSYRLTLNHEFEPERAKARLYHQIIIDHINNSYHHPEIKQQEGSTLIYIEPTKSATDKNGANCAEYQVNMTDKTFYMLDGVNFKYKLTDTQNTTLSFEFN